MKATQPAIYSADWKCCRCNNNNEDFNHIWLCPEIRSVLKTIISDSINHLKQQIFIQISKNIFSPDINKLLEPSHEIWAIKVNSHGFTFIDLVKGIILFLLLDTLTKFTKSSSSTNLILTPLYDFIFNLTYNLIWKTRCDLTITKEQSLNITNRQKRSNFASSNVQFSINSFSNVVFNNNFNNLDHIFLLINSYKHGRH